MSGGALKLVTQQKAQANNSHPTLHRSPTWIMVQCPSVKMLNLVCPQRKHKTQVMHMLQLIFEDDLPVSSMGQALQNNPPLLTTLLYFKTHD